MIVDWIFNVLLFAVFWFTLTIVMLLIVYGSDFIRLWQEPMLRYPVVIFESDDWGVGPNKEQLLALSDLLHLFRQHQDSQQHHPVLTLGMVLAEPDVERIKPGNKLYYRRDLSNEHYRELVQLIKNGQEENIFSIHLHGMEHFWPDSLMTTMQQQEVQQWLFGSNENDTTLMTENLPSYLQSRWCETSTLPSTPLKEEVIAKAIETEKQCFMNVFAQAPKVVVPPTFVWTDFVAFQYALQSIPIMITPGRQYTGRDASGALMTNGRSFYNGDRDEQSNTLYLVRDIYFEPQMGHKPNKVLSDIVNRTHCARPSLIEMHRFNFLVNKSQSLSELKKLLELITEQMPHTLFLSVEELASAYQAKNLLVQSFWQRMTIWGKRIQIFLQYKRLAKYSGFNFLLKLMK